VDDIGEVLVYFFLALCVIGFLGWGAAWLVQNELPYVITALSFAVVVLIAWYRDKQLRKKSALSNTRAMVSSARQAERALTEARQSLLRESRVLENLRLAAKDEINFELHRQRHYESMCLADSWHSLKRSAIETRNTISTGVKRLQASKSVKSRRGEALAELQSVVVGLNQEIDRGALVVEEHNARTRTLRNHIRDNCGTKGRLWHERLEARKQRKIIDN
jgi:hypothetical protein